ncbi:hypothetical protein J6590_030075 [Homalodisca vitripennis]|nr:hypothetical protein J6590_030075 [Homalodisca vitripennis]
MWMPLASRYWETTSRRKLGTSLTRLVPRSGTTSQGSHCSTAQPRRPRALLDDPLKKLHSYRLAVHPLTPLTTIFIGQSFAFSAAYRPVRLFLDTTEQVAVSRN